MLRFLSLCLLFCSCSVQAPPLLEDAFIKNMLAAKLYEVYIGIDASGNSVNTVDRSLPLEYTHNSSSFVFRRHSVIYTFSHSIDAHRAVFSYINEARGPVPENEKYYRAHIGFQLSEGGLYALAKKTSSPSENTYQAVIEYYSPANIDTEKMIPSLLYQSSQ